MKKLKKLMIGCGLGLSLFTIFNITNAVAQSVQQQSPVLGDTTCLLKEKGNGIAGDTFLVEFQVAIQTNDTFKGLVFEFQADTLNGADTAIQTVLVDWQDLLAGQLDYCSRVKMTSLLSGKIYYSEIEYWSLKGQLSRFDLTLGTKAMTDDGCIIIVDINNGGPSEKDTTFFDFRIKPTDKWRPTGIVRITTGVIKATSESLVGYGQNQTVYWRARGMNDKGGDTIYWDGTTNATAGEPIIDLDTAMYQSNDKGYVSYRIYGSNLPTDIWAKVKNVKTGIIDSIFLKNTKSFLQERFSFTFPTTGFSVKYEITLWANNSLGMKSSEMRWFVTPEEPVGTMIKSLPPVIFSGGIKPMFKYTMPMDSRFTQVDLKIWRNSGLTGAPIKSVVVVQNLTQSGEYEGGEILLPAGKYWGRYSVDDTKGIWPYSDTFAFEVKWGLGFENISSSNLPIQCKLYTINGQLISENYIVTPSVNLFDSWLPTGLLIAVPIETSAPFKVFNHQEGGM